MDSKGDFLAGVVVGAAVGTILGLLFAPKSGNETRQQIQARVSTLADDARERASEVGATIWDTVQDKVSAFRGQASAVDDAAGQTRPVDAAL